MEEFTKLCDLDITLYQCVTPVIRTDEVVITDERIEHIKERHPNDFERYADYIVEMIRHPQYILQSDMPHTAFILNRFCENGAYFQLILRLAVPPDTPGYKNSVITFLRISTRTWNKYLRNKKILYKSD